MSTPSHPAIPDHVQDNYRQVVAATGQTWGQLAAQFDRDAEALPDVHGDPYRRLAAWARDQDATATAGEGSGAAGREGTTPDQATPPRKRTTTDKRPTRTA